MAVKDRTSPLSGQPSQPKGGRICRRHKQRQATLHLPGLLTGLAGDLVGIRGAAARAGVAHGAAGGGRE